MSTMASHITSLTIVYLTVYSGVDQRKHQSSTSLAFVRGIRRWPVNSPHRGPVTWKMFPFDDVIISFLWVRFLWEENPRHSTQWGREKWPLFCRRQLWSTNIQISLTFVPSHSINNKPALVQIMALHIIDDEPLFKPMIGLDWICLTTTHILQDILAVLHM